MHVFSDHITDENEERYFGVNLELKPNFEISRVGETFSESEMTQNCIMEVDYWSGSEGNSSHKFRRSI